MWHQFELHFQHLGTSNKILADFINQSSYFVTSGEFVSFQVFNAKYQELHAKFSEINEIAQSEPRKTQELLRELIGLAVATSTAATSVVAEFLHRLIEIIKPTAIVNTDRGEINIKELAVNICRGYQQLCIILQTASNGSTYTTQKQAVIEQTTTFLGICVGYQEGLTKAIQYKHLGPNGFVKKTLLTNFEQALELQHLIYSTNKIQTDFSCVYRGIHIKTIPISQYLPKVEYSDLVFLTYLVQPAYVCQGLTNKLAILQYRNVEVQKKLEQFSNFNLLPIVRAQRIITAYQQWLELLTKQHGELHSDLSTAIFIQQLLTYDKKAILNKLFQNQTLTGILNQVSKTLEKFSGLPEAKVQTFFLLEKQTIKQKAATLEAEIRSKQTYWQAIIATFSLGIIKQPEYQLGQMAATINVHALDQFPHIPIIGAQLPQQLLTNLCHAVGSAFLSISLYVSNKFGYSYQLIAFINRMLLSQIDVLFKLGAYGEQLNQTLWYPIIDAIRKVFPVNTTTTWLKETIATDELGIIEKTAAINWLSGLGLQMVMTLGSNIIPSMLGYIAGTSVAQVTEIMVDKVAKNFDLNEETTIGCKVMTHFITYSYAYHYAYLASSKWLASAEPLMPQKQAYKILGLGQYVREKEVQQRYRELALQYHPDKCRENCEEGAAKMVEINAAYNVLKKKFA